MAEPKTKKTETSVGDYLAAIEPAAKRDDARALVELMRAVTGSEPAMWGTSIVGFGSYHYRYATGREGDWPIVGFGARKQNLTLYIMAGFAEYADLLARLGKHKTGKACLYVNKLADVDMGVLRELVERSVAHMRATYPTTT
jgi:hypothetical protein